MLINTGGKLTDIKRGLIKMLQSYKTIRQLIQKLTNKSPHHLNNIDTLISELKNVHRINQREVKHFFQLQLVSEVKSMLKSYLEKADAKFRRFDVYSHASCYLDVLATKITQFLPKNILVCMLTPQMMKWKLFLSEINENKQFLHSWLKSHSNHHSSDARNTQKSHTVYKFSTALTKANTPTTNYSCSQSLAGEFLEPEKQQTKRHSFLKRCQTAKPRIKSPHKKTYPINIRSPSAKQYIKAQSAKEPYVQKKLCRKTIKRKLFYKPQIESTLFLDGGIQIVNLKQSKFQNSKVHKKNNASVKEPYEKKSFYQYQSSAKQTIGSVPDQKWDDTTVLKDQIFQTTMFYHKTREGKSQRKSSMRKIKNFAQTQMFRSTFSKENFFDVLQAQSEPSNNEQEEDIEHLQDNTSDKQIRKPETKRGNTIIDSSSKDIPEEKEQQVPEFEENVQQKNLFSKKHKEVFPRKLNTRPQFQHEVPGHQRAEKKGHRRFGMISSKEIVSALKRIQSKQKEQEKEKQLELKRKAIEFNTNLLVEMENGDEEITQVEYQNQIALHPVTCSKVHKLYRQLTRLRKDQAKASKEAPSETESVFFAKQDFLRQEKSRQLQNYLRKINAKNTNIGEIFDLRSEDASRKVQNYMIAERQFNFEADNEWIRQNFKSNQIRDSQNEPELVQQDSRESWSAPEVQDF